MKKYLLVKPTKELVLQFNRFWTGNRFEQDSIIKLFHDMDAIDIAGWEMSKKPKKLLLTEFEGYGKKDKDIKGKKDSNFPEFLKAVNATYHTRLGLQPGHSWNDKEWNKSSIDAMCKDEMEKLKHCNINKENGIDAFIRICKKKTRKNAYSFATKVFSFMHPKEFPILDSITVSLLNHYIVDSTFIEKDMKLEYYGKKSWGEYVKYVADYQRFKESIGLGNLDNKCFDIFLWTYGILLNEYWSKVGVIKMEGVSYNS